MAENDRYTIDISQADLAEAIWLVLGLRGNLRATIDDLSIVRIDILHPLKQVDTLRRPFVSNKVNRGVIAPYDSIGFVAEVPRKPQNVAIEGRRGGRV